jgi:hypothetical protein
MGTKPQLLQTKFELKIDEAILEYKKQRNHFFKLTEIIEK